MQEGGWDEEADMKSGKWMDERVGTALWMQMAGADKI